MCSKHEVLLRGEKQDKKKLETDDTEHRGKMYFLTLLQPTNRRIRFLLQYFVRHACRSLTGLLGTTPTGSLKKIRWHPRLGARRIPHRTTTLGLPVGQKMGVCVLCWCVSLTEKTPGMCDQKKFIRSFNSRIHKKDIYDIWNLEGGETEP